MHALGEAHKRQVSLRPPSTETFTDTRNVPQKKVVVS